MRRTSTAKKRTGVEIPFGNLNIMAQDLVGLAAKYAQRRFKGMDEAFLRQFCADFAFEGPISPGRFKENLTWLRQQVPAAVPMFFLNGAEIEVAETHEKGVSQRHAHMNAALEDFVAKTANCYLVDVRQYINQRADVTNNVRHYQPRHYRTLAQQVAQAIGGWRGGHLSHSPWADFRARLWSRLPTNGGVCGADARQTPPSPSQQVNRRYGGKLEIKN